MGRQLAPEREFCKGPFINVRIIPRGHLLPQLRISPVLPTARGKQTQFRPHVLPFFHCRQFVPNCLRVAKQNQTSQSVNGGPGTCRQTSPLCLCRAEGQSSWWIKVSPSSRESRFPGCYFPSTPETYLSPRKPLPPFQKTLHKTSGLPVHSGREKGGRDVHTVRGSACAARPAEPPEWLQSASLKPPAWRA